MRPGVFPSGSAPGFHRALPFRNRPTLPIMVHRDSRPELLMPIGPRPALTPALLVAVAGAGVLAAPALAGGDNPVYLQWWENKWNDMEHRTPDFFMAGYGALWLPPVSKCYSNNSAGYDPWDRFDLGSPGAPTAYG